MLPKEHGAYGQLLFPLITALAIGRPSVAALAIVAVAVFIFLAHEPLLVFLGQRGPRAAREQRRRALTWLASCLCGAAVAGLIALATLEPSARPSVAIPVAPGLIAVALIAAGREHTAAGEIVSAVALSALAYPVALASGPTSLAARTCAVVFASGFVVATVCVRAVIANTRRPPAIDARGIGIALAVVAIALLISLDQQHLVERVAPWAAAPLAIGGGVLAIAPPSARQLRVVGWTLVATTGLTSVIAIVGLR